MARKHQWYLCGLCILALAFVLVTTSKYGAGVSSDASRNLSTVDSLLAGRGFVDMTGTPLTLWPPLYPLTLYVLSSITGLDPFVAGWHLNVFLFLLNTWLWSWMFYLVFRAKPWIAMLSSLILVLSRSALSLYANIASEPMFILFMLAFFFAAAAYLNDNSWGARWGMFTAASLAMLQRYPGIALLAVGVLVVLAKDGWRGAWKSILPAIAGILPVMGWAVLYTYAQTGTFFGPRTYETMLPLQNMSLSLTKILHWFVPFYVPLMPILMRPWLILLAIGVILLLINRKEQWLAWWQALRENVYVWPNLVFSVIYFVLMAFTVVTSDHLDLTSDRYYIIILPATLIFLFITLDHLVLSHLDLRKKAIRYTLGIAFAIWLVYPIYSLQEYLREALVRGEPSNYNIQNSRYFREQQAVKIGGQLLEEDPNAVMYSNYINVIWFAYRRPIPALPYRSQELSFEKSVLYLRQNYAGWPGDEAGYIIWFKPNQYHHVASPRELAEIAKLELIYQDDHGEVYRVTKK